jgi:alpha-methylacyl-CoA racemase
MGPLCDIRILEIGGIGPVPFAGMMLADMGADVLRIERRGAGPDLGARHSDVVLRGRQAVTLDMRDQMQRDALLACCESADALIEGFRPGVMERLGLGPKEALARNEGLVYGRMTGYGQDGPLSTVAGHDVNYISIAGVLDSFRRRGEVPQFPLNLVGDYGGGGMLLAFGVVCGVLEARTSGRGQVVDAAMVEGAALLSSLIHGFRAAGEWTDEPGTNFLDSGAHFYEVYETSDGGFVAVGAIEPQFYSELLRLLEVEPQSAPQWERERWPALKQRFAEIFRGRTRAEWAELLEHAEACSTPVLSMSEAPKHPHNRARRVFIVRDGVTQPAPAPRFSRTVPQVRGVEHDAEVDPVAALAKWRSG